MSESIPGRIRGIAILAGVLCGFGQRTVARAEIELDGQPLWERTTEISCDWEGRGTPDPVSWPDLIREIRETPATQVEDGGPPLDFDALAHDFEEAIRIVPKIELPDDRR